MEVSCYKCSTKNTFDKNIKVHRSDSCEKCLTDLHVCKMCKFYDISSYNECKESSADRITDKEKANFCDYFMLNLSLDESQNIQSDLMANANALFKD